MYDHELNKTLSEHFQSCLFSEEGKYVLDYVSGRGISKKTIEDFQLGWCPSNWNGFYKWKNRLMVPLINPYNDYISFHTRIITQKMNDSIGNEYIIEQNTNRIIKESFLNGEKRDHDIVWHHGSFDKNVFLFGLNMTKDYIIKQNYAIIVEGIFDLLILYENGIKNVVATLGTALGEHQFCLIKRYADRAVFMFDADKAGLKALEKARSKSLFEHKGMILPNNYDPHEFVLKYGIEPIQNGINKIIESV